MKIGMAGSSVMLLPWLSALREAVKARYEAFEVFGEFPQCICGEVPRGERMEGRELAAGAGVALAVHAPFNSVNIAALNPGIRRESIRQQKDAIDLCADLGGSAVVVHTGEYVGSEKVRREVPDAERIQWEFNVQSLREVAAHGRERGVIVCLENIGFETAHLDRNVDDLLRIRAEVDEPALAFCIDIGHARLNRELPEVIAKLGPLAAHLHFTDNFGVKDDHLVIGTGNFDYTPHLDFFRSFGHIITLEVVAAGTDPAKAIASKANFERIMGKS
jgi:sugar phosphate isomerase/epimerase